MSAFGLLILAGFFFYIAYAIGNSHNNKIAQMAENDKQNGIYYRSVCTYVGGWSELIKVVDVEVLVKDENVLIGENDSKVLSIKYKNIKNISVKMESVVKNDATVGKILLTGALAFASKKEESTYIFIEYLDEFDQDQTLALIGKFRYGKLVEEINNQRRKYINEA